MYNSFYYLAGMLGLLFGLLGLAMAVVGVSLGLIASLGMSPAGAYSALITGRWQAFRKMGIEGWKSFVPLYNTYSMFLALYGKQEGKSKFKCLFIPFYRIYLYIKFYFDLGAAFNTSTGMKWGLWLMTSVFLPIVG